MSSRSLEQRVQSECRAALRGFGSARPLVAVFGSARAAESDPMYEKARLFGKTLAAAGFGVITGGGPGIMEAANRGAKEGGAPSFGACINLPHEQVENRYVDRALHFEYFFTRKLALLRGSCGFACFPGGFGTADELFEALTLIQTGKLPHFPIVLMGSGAWDELLAWLESTMEPSGAIEARDRGLLHTCDSISEAIGHFARCHQQLCSELGPGPHYPA